MCWSIPFQSTQQWHRLVLKPIKELFDSVKLAENVIRNNRLAWLSLSTLLPLFRIRANSPQLAVTATISSFAHPALANVHSPHIVRLNFCHVFSRFRRKREKKTISKCRRECSSGVVWANEKTMYNVLCCYVTAQQLLVRNNPFLAIANAMRCAFFDFGSDTQVQDDVKLVQKARGKYSISKLFRFPLNNWSCAFPLIIMQWPQQQ